METLALDEQFDVVRLGSHFINAAEVSTRAALFSVCALHARPGGVVFVERYAPEWARELTGVHSEQDGVTFMWHDVVHRGDGFDAAVTYEVGTHSWTQRSSAAVLEDDQLVAGAAAAGLVFDCWLDFAEWFQAPDVARANSHGYRP